jgi:hypothetical protein
VLLSFFLSFCLLTLFCCCCSWQKLFERILRKNCQRRNLARARTMMTPANKKWQSCQQLQPRNQQLSRECLYQPNLQATSSSCHWRQRSPLAATFFLPHIPSKCPWLLHACDWLAGLLQWGAKFWNRQRMAWNCFSKFL